MEPIITSIRQWIESVLGVYQPVTYTAKAIAINGEGTYATTSWTEVAHGVAGLDWGYICTAIVLVVTIYSVFRLLGVLLQALCGGYRR